MVTRVDLEPAYVLHARAYRETSQLLELFTHSHGRIGVVARGARRPKSKFRGLLNPFQPLRISWSARDELGTLRDAEPAEMTPDWGSRQLMAGFYVNELLMRLLQRGDPHPLLFSLYTSMIGEMGDGQRLEGALRRFELFLLREIGYALNLETDSVRHLALDPAAHYRFDVDAGAVPVEAPDGDGLIFTGAELLAIGREEFSEGIGRRAAKRLLRHVIAYHLGERGLETRRVAAAMKR